MMPYPEFFRVHSPRLAAAAVIPAPHQVRDKLQPESREPDWIPRIKYGAGSVKHGMTFDTPLLAAG